LLSGKPTRWLLPVAGLAALIIVMLHPITPPRSAVPASDSLFATALASLTTIESLSSSNGDEVGEWLQLHVGYAVEVPHITGASLVGGRIAVLDGASAAAVAYTMHGKPLTFIVLPTASTMSESIAEDNVRTESANGYNVAIWRELGLVRAVVSPMSSQLVSSVAYQCKRTMPTESL
jgi:anti-sigma factor RsiW